MHQTKAEPKGYPWRTFTEAQASQKESYLHQKEAASISKGGRQRGGCAPERPGETAVDAWAEPEPRRFGSIQTIITPVRLSDF